MTCRQPALHRVSCSSAVLGQSWVFHQVHEIAMKYSWLVAGLAAEGSCYELGLRGVGAPPARTAVACRSPWRCAAPSADAGGTPAELARRPGSASDLLTLGSALLQLEPTPLALAQLTDAIDHPQGASDAPAPLVSVGDFARRARRKQLLSELLRADRAAYVETVSFLNVPRDELPNRQDVPLRECDPQPRAGAPAPSDGGDEKGDELVADCALPDVAMGENAVEGALLSVTRDIYAGETGVSRSSTSGIVGLIDEMREYMLSERGGLPEAQQAVLVRTLKTLMTPVLPPFYRIFMGGTVPSEARGDPRWLVDSVQWVANRLEWMPFDTKKALAPGNQPLGGPMPYAPLLTSVVAPYVFGFLVGPASLNRRADGGVGGLVVEKCKFLQESNCKGMCLNSCKMPAQTLFS